MTPEQIDFVKRAKKMWMSTDEIMSKIKSNDTSLDSPDQQAPQPQQKSSWFADYIKKTIPNIGAWVWQSASNTVAWLWEVGKQAAFMIPTWVVNAWRKLIGKKQMYVDNPDWTRTLDGQEQQPTVWDKAQWALKNYGQNMWADTESLAFKAGKVWTDIAQIATPTGATRWILWLLWKYPELVQLAENSPRIATALKLAFEWATAAQKTSIVTDSKPATLWQTAAGAVLNPAIAWVWSLVWEAAKKYITRATNIDTPEQIAWKISQLTDPKKLQKVVKAVKELPEDKIGTYSDLEKVTSDLLSKKAAAQDAHLSTIDKVFTPKNTNTIVQGSTSKIKDNFVKSALDNLSKLYKTTRDLESLVKIQDLTAKFKKDWLSAKELNDLAREFWSKEKAFNKAGDLLWGNTAISNENVRKWLKDLLRNNLPDETSKTLDAAYSQMSTLKQSATDMVKKVNKTRNTTDQPWLLEWVWETAINVLDTATMWLSKWIRKGLTESNAGKKTLNNLWIEEKLLQNIKKLKNYDEYVKGQKANWKAIEITKQAFDKLRKTLVAAWSKLAWNQ